MKALITTVAFYVALSFFAVTLKAQGHSSMQQQGNQEHTMLNQDGLQWKDGPASLPKGVKVAILEGDPAKEGPFTMRLLLPANYKIPAHHHPAIEHITVLKGSLYMGTGETLDMSRATKLSEGGFAVMPVKFVHYAFTREEATIQLHGVGPWDIIYVDPKNDPRKAK